MCLKKTVLVINCWEMVGPGSVQPGYGSEDLDLYNTLRVRNTGSIHHREHIISCKQIVTSSTENSLNLPYRQRHFICIGAWWSLSESLSPALIHLSVPVAYPVLVPVPVRGLCPWSLTLYLSVFLSAFLSVSLSVPCPCTTIRPCPTLCPCLCQTISPCLTLSLSLSVLVQVSVSVYVCTISGTLS
jgi:hypothetical protein